MQLPKTGDLLLGKYVLEGLLGEGGMGLVYSARHQLLGQRVAVKLIRPEFATRVDTVSRFVNEARAAASIQNEHIAHVLDVGSLDSGLPYMVLEYLDGRDLASVLQAQGPLPVSDVADYLLGSRCCVFVCNDAIENCFFKQVNTESGFTAACHAQDNRMGGQVTRVIVDHFIC